MSMGVLSFEQVAVGAGATALTPPAGARTAHLQADTANVRYRTDGTNPTASVGMRILSSDPRPTVITLEGGLNQTSVIAESGSPKLNITWYGHTD